ncbi:MAG TPA: Nif3-like dinuclear metal center hexameric protein [Puia sp.]|nr:Nif3-like dinuclear metal center hexameric protein [Puia sp.]
MKIASIISCLETAADPSYQEDYDNTGLLTGSSDWECSGILLALDATASIVQEAIQRKCNLVIAHHPIIFTGLKKINEKNYIGQAIIPAIKNDIAIYAIHTNLDNVLNGVNGRIADKMGLVNRRVLLPRPSTLRKLYTFVPFAEAEQVRTALFKAGAGHIGNYSEVSFNTEGTGTYTPGEGSHPYKGDQGQRHEEKEIRIEVIFPAQLQPSIVEALIRSHPYEEIAYDLVSLENTQTSHGSGLLGDLPEPANEVDFLARIKSVFGLSLIRHTRLTGRPVFRVAVCGGAGNFLISKALAAGADFFITADVKYHEFFDAEDSLVLADIGHFESEQFTIDLLYDLLLKKFPTFAVLKPVSNTNPVHYYF